MPVIHRADAPTFHVHGADFVGLAAPSRGSNENSVWQTTLPPGAPGVEHSLDREEIIVVVSGQALATLDGKAELVSAGDAIVVPPARPFALANPHDAPLTLIAILPVGGRAKVGDEPAFVPSWAQ
jgi:quercetin dioxygenase-like cupin family protein